MNKNITTSTSTSASDSNNDNGDKRELYYEKLQFQLQVQQERFNVEQEKFNLEKEKFNVEKEMFKVEQDRFNAEKETEKEKFKVEEDKFQVKHDKFPLEEQTIEQLLEPYKQLELYKQLESYKQQLEQLHDEIATNNTTINALRNENDQLKKELESVKKAEQERIEKERIEKERIEKESIAKRPIVLKSIFDTNVASFDDTTELHLTFITIENLNKTIHIHFYPHKSFIETLWADPETALFSILKNDWDNGNIPKVLNNTVKLFVSSPDVLINDDGKEEWIQISGDGVESSLPPPYTEQITAQSLVKYIDSYQYEQTFDNDRCPQGENCAQHNNPNCLYHFGKVDSFDYNCQAAHHSTTRTYPAQYHIKLKWC